MRPKLHDYTANYINLWIYVTWYFIKTWSYQLTRRLLIRKVLQIFYAIKFTIQEREKMHHNTYYIENVTATTKNSSTNLRKKQEIITICRKCRKSQGNSWFFMWNSRNFSEFFKLFSNFSKSQGCFVRAYRSENLARSSEVYLKYDFLKTIIA